MIGNDKMAHKYPRNMMTSNGKMAHKYPSPQQSLKKIGPLALRLAYT